MDEQGCSNPLVRDSFELYESPGKVDLTGSEGAMNGGGAPGSPGSMLEYRQAINSLKQELRDSRKRELELSNMLRAAQSSTLVVDPQYVNLEVSSSNDSLGENVKDAHIKYLQRQVTVLQASLYKYEGWSNRMVAITKEKDEALNELVSLKSENAILAEKNRILQMEIDTMEANYQRRLQQNQAERENLIQQGVRSSDLMLGVRGREEELERLKAENRTLKESLSRLESENKTLKDYSVSFSSSNHSLGNVACSQELEYLHRVVDTLKKTVLEQRRFLLSIRSPNMSSSVKETPNLSPAASQNGLEATLGKDTSSLQKLTNSSSGADVTLRSSSLSQQLKQPAPINKPNVDKGETGESLFDTKGMRVPNTAGVAEGSYGDPFDNLKVQNSFNVIPRNMGSLADSRKPPSAALNSGGESTRQTLGLTNVNGYIRMYSPHQKVSQSEILGRRVAEEQSNQPMMRSHSATIAHNPEYVNAPTRPVKSEPMPYMVAVKEDSSNNIGYNLKPGQPPSHSVNYDPPRQIAWESVQLLLDDNPVTTSSLQKENLRQQQGMQNPVTTRADPTSNYNRTNNMLSSSNTPALPPPPLAHRPKSQVSSTSTAHFYANGQDDTVILRDPKPVQSRSDRLCPVCGKDFGDMGMEDFQAHVFRCFDDDEAPETMKPQEVSRLCPMCGMAFNNSTPQAEFEKHVHSHFGEDNPVDNFEILHP